MFKNLSLIKRCGELLSWGLVAGILVAGCGGGGGSSTGTALPSTELGDFIANSTGGSMNYAGSWSVQGGSTSAVINVTTLAMTGTNTYTRTNSDHTLTGTTWSATTVTIFDLASTLGDWIQRPTSATFQDSGDGRHATITPTGEAAYTATFTKTNLAGTAYSANTNNCLTCAGYGGNYPANAALYTQTLNVDWFSMSETLGEEVTDNVGNPLTNTTPNVGDTFCDPYQGVVFNPNGVAPPSNNYDVLPAASCSSVDIAAAINTPAVGATTALVSSKATGRALVNHVLLITSSDPIYNNTFYASNGTHVWYGTMIPAGSTFKTYENSTAIRGELAKGGYASYP